MYKSSVHSRKIPFAEIAHAGQTWTQPKRGTTNPKLKGYVKHYSDSNKEPSSIVKARKRAGWRKITKLYVIRFRHQSGLSFLKIGITDYDVEVRFAADVERYSMEIIKIVNGLRRKTALVLESALHKMLKGKSMRPPIPLLSGGNSECFIDCFDLENKINNLLKSLT